MGISISVYYKIAHRIGKRPTEEDIKHHIATRKNGRPRKETF